MVHWVGPVQRVRREVGDERMNKQEKRVLAKEMKTYIKVAWQSQEISAQMNCVDRETGAGSRDL